jgi:predicted Zn-ribbon and HTH transcriptional regulator
MEEKLPVKAYACKDCGNKFKGIGKNVTCPSCQSKNVAES